MSGIFLPIRRELSEDAAVISKENEVENRMQRLYLGISFLAATAIVFGLLIAIDKMIGG